MSKYRQNILKGYIAVTDPKWFNFHKTNNHKEVIFWRRYNKPVNLQIDDYFFFLIKGKLPRFIKGYGKVESIGIQKISTMWDLYKELNGSRSLASLTSRIKKNEDQKVAFYKLKDVVYFTENYFITDKEINFVKDIVSGTSIFNIDPEPLSRVV